jgi:hypothetical protein
MLTLQQMLKIDPALSSLSDTELEELRTALYGWGQLAFDIWWQKKNGSKNPLGSLTNKQDGGIVDVWKSKPNEQE